MHPREWVVGAEVLVQRHASGWDKSATNRHEVRGKTLGMFGHDKIDTRFGMRVEGLDMRVMHDDVMSPYVPEPSEIAGHLVNASRGTVVDLEMLAAAPETSKDVQDVDGTTRAAQ